MNILLFGVAGLWACGDKDGSNTVSESEMDTETSSDTETNTDTATDVVNDDTSPEVEDLSCDDVPDCGGDLIGVWNYAELCGETDIANVQQYREYQLDYCPQITNWDAEETMTGTIEFTNSGRVQNTFRLSVEYLFTWPLSDCPLASGSTSCTDLNPDELHIPPNVVSFGCVDGVTEENCDCVSVHELSREGETNYSVDGNTVTIEDGNDQSSNQFCVQGDGMLSKFEQSGDTILYTRME